MKVLMPSYPFHLYFYFVLRYIFLYFCCFLVSCLVGWGILFEDRVHMMPLVCLNVFWYGFGFKG